MNFLYVLLDQPLLNALIFLYKTLFSNLGLAIIGLTVVIRLALIPLMTPQMKSAKKMQELAPEIAKLKKKFAGDKQKFAQAQMELFKEHKINPAAGCLPQILQIVLLFSLYKVFNQVIQAGSTDLVAKINEGLYNFNQLPIGTSSFNTSFLYLNLSQPDLIKIPGLFPLPGVFVILATIFQFLSSKLMMAQTPKKALVTTSDKDEKPADDMSGMLQKQMLYMFPAMTLIFGYTLPAGVSLYWFIFSLFSFGQQLLVNRQSQNGGK